MGAMVKQAKDMAVLFLQGEIHRETSDELFRLVDEALGRGCKTVVFSFKDVAALLSEGIRCLVALQDHVSQKGKELVVTDLPKEVHYTLKITNLLEFLHYRESLDGILAASGLTQRDLKDPETLKPPPPPPTPVSSMAAKAEEMKAEKPKERTLRPDEVKHLIHRYVPGRIAMAIVEFFIRHNKSIADLPEIVRATRENEKEVQKAAELLAKRGVLKAMGANVFNFKPEGELHHELAALVAMWHTDLGRRKILPLLIVAEKS